MSLPSSHCNYILFPLLLHKRYLQGGYDVRVMMCHCLFILLCSSKVQWDGRELAFT